MHFSNSKALNRGGAGFPLFFFSKAQTYWKFLLFTTHEANTCHCRFYYTLEVVQLDLEVKESWPWHMLNWNKWVWRGYGRVGKLIQHTHSCNCRMLIVDVLCANFSDSLGINSLKGVETSLLPISSKKVFRARILILYKPGEKATKQLKVFSVGTSLTSVLLLPVAITFLKGLI